MNGNFAWDRSVYTLGPQWKWDQEIQAGYLKLSNDEIVSTVISHDAQLNLDLNEDNKIVGIEVLL